MNITTKKAGFALATTAALLLAGCAADDKDTGMKDMEKGTDMGQCHGVNSCKGTSACATAESSCTGHNSCKGKGWLKMSEKACAEAGGKFMK